MSEIKKIAVFGSCFSRNFLSTQTYFNPDYKDYFNCIYTQFHSSIIAIISEPISIQLDPYDDIPLEKKKFVKMDFEKKFWKELEKEIPEYLIIDLYSDALKNVGWLSSDCAITISPIIEQSRLNEVLEFTNILDHSNNKVYKDKFRDSLIQFKDQILIYMDENQIILNKGRLTKSYYNENGEIKYFNNLEMIDSHNQFWEELDDIFVGIFPECKVVDINHFEFIGDVRYPFGTSVSHYETNFYKELMRAVKYSININ